MKKPWMASLIVACGLTLASQGSGAAAQKKPAAPVDPMTVTQQLNLKDDQGKNWVLKNAKEYRMKWSYEDPSRYQHFEGFLAPDGKLLFIIAFDYAMGLDLNGKVVWKQPLESGFYQYNFIGADNTAYFLEVEEPRLEVLGDAERLDDSEKRLSGIERVDVRGRYVRMPPVSVYAPQDENGFSMGYPMYAGDAKGNLLLLTTEGLAAYRPDGTVAWKQTGFTYKDRTYDSFALKNLFSDEEGFSYLQFEDDLLKIDSAGVVQWRTAISENADYFVSGRYLIAQTFDMKSLQPAYQVYAASADGKLTLVTDPKAQFQTMNGWSDQAGGVYRLDDRTSTLTDTDSRTGKIKWTHKLTPWEKMLGYSLAQFTMRTDSAGNVYFSANVGTVYSLDRQGKPRFAVTMSNSIIAYSDIIPISDKQVVILNNNHIAFFEKKG
ncbi:hypothetical protein [Cohnella caldifontis]|uniref:hypothetical protein n=1 Tax=Cohnella caldifontis TaxID=3027471 RepID=UPI0023EC0744|nr:hypothetical protein [Cohnella sp. YIM B05605]